METHLLTSYKGYEFSPKAKDIPSNICPFCNFDANHFSNIEFTLHMKKCFLKGFREEEDKLSLPEYIYLHSEAQKFLTNKIG